MQKIILTIFAAILLLNIVIAAQQEVYVLNLKYDKGNISILNLMKTKGFYNKPVDEPKQGYRLDVVSFENKLLYSQKFNFELEIKSAPLPEWFDEHGNQIYFPKEEETRIIKDSDVRELIFPYFENAQRIDIYNPNDILVLSFEVNTAKIPKVTEKVPKERFKVKMLHILLIGLIIILSIGFIYKKKKRYLYE